MPLRKPSYRFHKARNCAVVTIDGHDHYLGAFDSPESWEKYHRLVAEWFASRNLPPVPADPVAAPLTVSELTLAYWRFVQSYYVKNGKPTSEQNTIHQALCFVRRLYGSTPAQEFSPKKLKAIRHAMVEHTITCKVKVSNPQTGEVQWQAKVLRHGLARKFINKQIGRIKRMFAWGVEEDLVAVTVHQALLRVKGLKKGKTPAREKPRVKPVAEAQVAAVLPLLSATIRTMVEVQRLCGGRPQDIVEMRAGDIDMTGPVWEYHPGCYKTEHHNDDDNPDRERIVFLGPRAQALLKPFLGVAGTDYLFSPRRSEESRNADRRTKRSTPRWPSHVRRQARKQRPREKAPLRDHYDRDSYRRAVRRACKKAGIPIWHPNQLRHSRLTEIRKHFGLEASKACAGHREIGVTQHYAEQDRTLANKVMAEIG